MSFFTNRKNWYIAGCPLAPLPSYPGLFTAPSKKEKKEREKKNTLSTRKLKITPKYFTPRALGQNKIFLYPKHDPPSGIYSCPDAKMFSSLGQKLPYESDTRLNYARRSNHISDLAYVILLTKGHCLLIVDIRLAWTESALASSSVHQARQE